MNSHLSWERSASYSTSSASSFNKTSNRGKKSHSRSSHHRSAATASSKPLDLLTFGYGCKLFNDEDQARYLEQGKNLIPFDGDSNLLIDRFDVRGYLNAIDLHKYEAKIDVNYKELLTEEEIELEAELDKERYRDLYAKEQQEVDRHEEDLKRLKASIEEDDKRYNQIQFDYNSLQQNERNEDSFVPHNNRLSSKYDDKDDEKYTLPDGLIIPTDLSNSIQLPYTLKEHNLIEKTAKFISKQGPQMEIILKTKQSSNSQFDFLSYDSPLNPYYKFLVQAIKDGSYKPKQLKEDDADYQQMNAHQTTDESDDDAYLHPSLLSSNRLKQEQNYYSYNVPVNRSMTMNSLYSKLAENLKDKIVVNDKSYSEPKVIESKPIRYNLNKQDETESTKDASKQDTSKNTSKKDKKTTSVKSVFDLMPEIPAEIKLIIEKLAQYVSKNGDEFEKQVKSRNESRFQFLNQGHKYHWYYIKTKLKLLEEKRKLEQRKSSNNNDNSSMKKTEQHRPLSQNSNDSENDSDSAFHDLKQKDDN